MPPKRKQTAEASSSRSTRSSTKKQTTTGAASSSGTSAPKASTHGSAESAAVLDDDNSDEPVRKKPRKAATSRKAKATPLDDDSPIRKVPSKKEFPQQSVTNSEPVFVASMPAPASSKFLSRKSSKIEPYTSQRAVELFKTYADKDDADVIGPEGFEQLCTDAGMPLDGPRPIILAWQLGAKEMAKISLNEWVTGTSNLKVSSVVPLSLAISELDDLLIQGKSAISINSKKEQEYDRKLYLEYSADSKAAFQKLYSFSFMLAKPEQSKNIEMETSVAFWTVLLVPKFPIMVEVLQFINEKGSYKATNKDLWSMMLEFCQTVSPNLHDYEADGAWPTLLDDFVAWKRSQSGNGHA